MEDRAGKGGKSVNVSNFGKGRISEAMKYLTEKWAAKWYKGKGGDWKSKKEANEAVSFGIFSRKRGKFLIDPTQMDPETGMPMPALFTTPREGIPTVLSQPDKDDLMLTVYDPKKETIDEKISFFYKHQMSKLLIESGEMNVLQGLRNIVHPPTGVRGLIRKIKLAVGLREDLQGNKESDADYRKRLKRQVHTAATVKNKKAKK